MTRSASLTSGQWQEIQTPEEHASLLAHGTIRGAWGSWANVQRGDFGGPGKYLLICYYQRCPRNCCDDLVRELLPASEVATAVREEMRELAQLLKEARK